MNNKTFRSINEATSICRLRNVFRANWPSYRSWYFAAGNLARPSYLECRDALRHYMPELLPLYDELIATLECDDEQARFLSLYNPPPFFSGCSQLIVTGRTNALIRNYDFPPFLSEGVVLLSAWQGVKVLAMSDCIWGVLDGLNRDGLAVSLAFGGEGLEGQGFGIALVLRYLLQTCGTVPEAIEKLQVIPVHTDYNIALLDASGQYATVRVEPGLRVLASTRRHSTNQPEQGASARYASLSDTATRDRALAAVALKPAHSLAEKIAAFTRPPLYRPHERFESGTLYTAVYYPETLSADYLWPSGKWHLSLTDFREKHFQVHFHHNA